MIEQAIYSRLSQDPGVVGLIGPGYVDDDIATPATILRLGFRFLPLKGMKVTPCATYRRVSTVREFTLDAASELTQVRVEISCYAIITNYGDAKRLSRLIRNSLNGVAWNAGGYEVIFCKAESERSKAIKRPLAQGMDAQSIHTEYLLWFREEL